MITGLTPGGSLGLLGFYRTSAGAASASGPSGADAAAAGVTLASGQSGPQDTVFLSDQAQDLLTTAALMNDLAGSGASPVVTDERLLSLVAALGPVVVNGSASDTAPEVTLVRRSTAAPDYGSAAFASAAEAIRGALGAPATPGTPEPPGPDFASVRTGAGDDVILFGGTAGAPTEGLNALADGGAGNDRVVVTGNALVRGGAGDDSVEASGGSLILAFGRGDGADSVSFGDATGSANLVLGDLNAADVEVARSGSDLVLRIRDTGESVTLAGYDPATRGGVVTFGDGTKRDLTDLVV